MKYLTLRRFPLPAVVLFFLATGMCMAQKTVKDTVFLQSFGKLTLWDKSVSQLYSFTNNSREASTLPGKVIEVEEGDSVHIYSSSTSNDGFHTIHLHGLDVNTENDGDPMTSFPIAPYSSYTYKFLATHAGTYIYHCHVGDVMHVQMGMYALIIVKPKGSTKTAWTNGPTYSRSYSWLTSELDQFWHENTPYAMMNDFKVPVYNPNYFLINGKSKQQLDEINTAIVASSSEKIYLRLANIGFYKHQFIFPASLNPEVIDSDGRPLPKSFMADTLNILPGERYGVMLSAPISLLAKVKINFIDMNTKLIKGVEEVPINITFNTAVEGRNSANKLIKLSPNPAKDLINVSLFETNESSYTLKIKDLFGRVYSEIYCQGNDTKQLNISTLATGMYIIETNIRGTIFSEKFIVQ